MEAVQTRLHDRRRRVSIIVGVGVAAQRINHGATMHRFRFNLLTLFGFVAPSRWLAACEPSQLWLVVVSASSLAAFLRRARGRVRQNTSVRSGSVCVVGWIHPWSEEHFVRRTDRFLTNRLEAVILAPRVIYRAVHEYLLDPVTAYRCRQISQSSQFPWTIGAVAEEPTPIAFQPIRPSKPNRSTSRAIQRRARYDAIH